METVYVTITVKVQKNLAEHTVPPYKGEVAELRLPLEMLAAGSSDLASIFTALAKAASLRFTGTEHPNRGWDQP